MNARTASAPAVIERGAETSSEPNVEYRLGRLQRLGLLRGRWLDCGCANGGYTRGLSERGVRDVVGLEIERDRLEDAMCNQPDATTFPGYVCGTSEWLPFAGEAFDGVLLNEVLEHVADEMATLHEVHRVLRPAGNLVVMSPNRLFPIEGHGMRLGSRNVDYLIPLLPWLPSRLALRFMRARNYWPRELQQLVRAAGFRIVHSGFVPPTLSIYSGPVPARVASRYRRLLPAIERSQLAGLVSVSTLIVARKP